VSTTSPRLSADRPIEGIDVEELRGAIRDVPDFPQPGILFRDITPLLANGPLFHRLIDALQRHYQGQIDAVVAIESRGFIFGAPLAYALGVGVVPVRKAGKLPYQTHAAAYSLEYGEATLEIHVDAIGPEQRVLLVDDLLATGGTVRAAADLVERLGATIAGVFVLAELDALDGRARLGDYDVRSLIHY
jgi:adenine phosphoribosyltransferase